MRIRELVLFFVLLLIFLPIDVHGEMQEPKVYMIITNKLTLEDIQSMPNLNKIIDDSSIGLMNTRGVSGYTGPESFMTINSSSKAKANFDTIDFFFNGQNIVNNYIDRVMDLNEDNNYVPFIGALGDNLEKAGLTTGIYGNSDLIDRPIRTSALIPMSSKGIVHYGDIDNINIEDKSYPFILKTDFSQLLEKSLASPADLVVIDTGDLERLFRYDGYLTKSEYRNIRDRILLDLDDFLLDFKNSIDKENSLLIITSPNSGDSRINNSRLSPLIIWGKSYAKGTLTSSTTNRNMIVSNLDLGPTILNFFRVPMENMSGNTIESIRSSIGLENLIEENQRVNTTSKARYNTLYLYSIYSMVLFSIAIILLIGRIKLTSGIDELFKVLFNLLLVMPALFIIESIFRPRTIYGFLFVLFILIVSSFTILWLTRRHNNQTLYISIITVSVIVLDLFFYGYISRYSVLSHDPIIGARYYGIGNEMAGVFLGSITILGIILLEKTSNGVWYLLLLITATLLTGYPTFGANVGGFLAFLIGLSIFTIEYLNIRLNIRKSVIIIASLASLLVLLAFIDVIFIENVTHLGKALLTIRENGLEYFMNIVNRKLLMNIKLVGRSFWTNLLLIHMMLYGLIFYKSNFREKNIIGFIAGVAGALGGFLLNDSGLILTAICMNLITIKLYIDYTWKKVE